MNVRSLAGAIVCGAIGAATLALGGCATTEGDTPEERRSYVMDTHDQTLADLYEVRPEAEEKVQNAEGYGVFSTIDTNVIFLATGGGYGVVVDNETGERTYMRMGELGVGPGVGIKDMRLVLVFHDHGTLHEFTTSGWQFGGSADASAQSGDQGASPEIRGTVGGDIEVYQITESGVSLQATVRGTRFWRSDELNEDTYHEDYNGGDDFDDDRGDDDFDDDR